MRKQYHLTLNCTQEEAERRLKMQQSPFILGGKVGENSFKIYKRPTGLISSRGILRSVFCFYGEYQQTGTNTEITYQVRPYVTIVITYLILGLVFLWMIIAAIAIRKDIFLTVFSGTFFLLFFCLITHWEKKKCFADFEKRLNTETCRY